MRAFAPDIYLYALHVAFWAAFLLTRLLVRSRGVAPPSPLTTDTVPPAVPAPVATARFSRLAFVPHLIAFALLYTGIDNAVFHRLVPEWFAGQRIVGALVIVAGAALAVSALLYFHSWRFRAQLDAKHELATGGPFRYLRNPIYMGLNLLALGSAIWVPTTTVWIAVALMFIGSDVRARVEESVLRETFGEEYRAYAARTRRFVPGIY
ncbi:MAG TPA: isoprenylcysteine carboxylmethyltransferase family protein [Gemmatimonadaceae bacterium]|nr:isoprenylcysteine carboxylmethyltransferase family protein [Gemmatimonadaceae bacterium]